jgi:hypothetical protein
VTENPPCASLWLASPLAIDSDSWYLLPGSHVRGSPSSRSAALATPSV